MPDFSQSAPGLEPPAVIDHVLLPVGNLERILDEAGATPADVAKVTIFMRDVAQRPLINPIRQEFFGQHRPASTLVEISRLVRDELLLEIEAVAQLPDA